MKVMICISQLKRGGAERVVCNLANYFSTNNETILVSTKNYEPEYDINENVKIYKLDNNEQKNRILKNILRIKELDRIVKTEKPDITLCFLPEPSFMNLILKRKNHNKVIISVRNDPKIEYKNPVYKFLMKRLYPLADGVVFQTKDAQAFFSKEIQERSTIILNPLNPDFLLERYKGKRKKEIVSVGRLFEQKNHKMLIDAFKIFNEKNKGYKLIIYGEGPLKDELQKYIDDLKLADSIILAGLEKNIKQKIYDASFFVLSSDYEGLPNSLMEALTLGLPCISTDCPCGGPRTLITNEYNGLLVEVGNPNDLAEKMCYMASNPEKAEFYSKNTRDIVKMIDPNIINEKWNDYLKKIANK